MIDINSGGWGSWKGSWGFDLKQVVGECLKDTVGL